MLYLVLLHQLKSFIILEMRPHNISPSHYHCYFSTRLLNLICFYLLITMNGTSSLPSSLIGKPVCALVPPGKCQLGEDFVQLPLLERTKVSPTSSVLRFGLPDKSQPLNLSTCACILSRNKENGEDVIRPYTSISPNTLNGCFDLLIKDYGPDGKMSHHMCTIDIGDTVEFKHISGNVKIQAPFPQKKIVMLIGGTGITPMIQALHAILGDDDSSNDVTLLYGSKVEADILARDLLEKWADDYADKFQLVHILSDEPEDSEWNGLRGQISKELLEQHLPDPSIGNDLVIFICGPPPMYDALCGPRGEKELKGLLAEMGYKAEQVYKF